MTKERHHLFNGVIFVLILCMFGCNPKEELLDNINPQESFEEKYDCYIKILRQSFSKNLNANSRAEKSTKRLGDILAKFIFESPNEQLITALDSLPLYNDCKNISTYTDVLKYIDTNVSTETSENYDLFVENYIYNRTSTLSNFKNTYDLQPETLNNLYVATIAYIDEVIVPIGNISIK